MLRDLKYGLNASRGVSVYVSAFAVTKLYRLMTEAHGCQQLAQGCYSTARRPGLEPATTDVVASKLPSQRACRHVCECVRWCLATAQSVRRCHRGR